MWDPEGASKHINDYLELTDGYAKMGACLAVGYTFFILILRFFKIIQTFQHWYNR